ncbi:SMC-Scp complex subunit ScpB, partial [Rhizobiaceae sp. 2RAB30]
MTDSSNAAVIPFIIDDEDGDNSGNRVERLFLSEAIRMAEAIIFASAESVTEKALAARLPDGVNLGQALNELQRAYEKRGVNLVKVGDAWA